MQKFPSSPTEMLHTFFKNRALIFSLSERQIHGRYRGSFMDSLWPFLNPLIMLAIYTFIFSVVFKTRWSIGSDSKIEFALVLYLGLIIFNIFSECINSATTLVLLNANYVKRVVFPLEILPIISIASALFYAFISLAIWIFVYILAIGLPPPTIILFPVVIFPFILFTLGTSWLLAAIGVYVRDVGQVVSILISALMFLSPVFYPIDSIPVSYQLLFRLNPLTPVIEQMRNIFMWGLWPSWKFQALWIFVSFFVAWLGFAIFQKLRKGFADVI
ncbi:ABC transporter permease [Polynucleobacter paneuropaeus]|nr:ABC transporter permease [Polynucleobacter paneuropaeus]